jgi:hypothetical protein
MNSVRPATKPAGAAVYTPLVLGLYDAFVLGFSNRFVWRCATQHMLARYEAWAGPRHLDVGVATGWYLDRCRWPRGCTSVALLDVNDHALRTAAARIQRYSPRTIHADVLGTLDLGDAQFDSIALNYLFHCLPGGVERNAVRVLDRLWPHVAPGGVLFGSTILGKGVRHNALGRRLIDVYNRRGIFSNTLDTVDGLRRAAPPGARVDIDVCGTVALFVVRSSESSPVAPS